MGCREKKSRVRAVFAAAVAMAALAGGCSAPLVPPARLPKETRAALPDTELLEALRRDWQALKTVSMPEAQRGEVLERYNRNLLILLKRYRVDILAAGKKGRAYFPPEVGLVSDVPLAEAYDDVVPAADIRFDILKEHYIVHGVGVPLVGIIPAGKVEKLRGMHAIRTRGTVRNLTAVLEFPEGGGKPQLHLIPRNRRETVRIGKLEYRLAGDFSAAIEQYWDLTQIEKGRMLGLLRPQELRDVTGLSCIEGYDPDKIPVILTHGLFSTAGTFDNMVNRLMSDPEIRRNYQFWYFNYPTGVSWTVTAGVYRQSLQQLRDQLDPAHTNRNWDAMVVVGHSMGGLITHYSQCTEPWLMLRQADSLHLPRADAYLTGYYVDHPFPQRELNGMRADYYFRPVQAGMVVYLATPHRGAPLARYRIATFLMRLVELPQDIIDEAIGIATLQEGTLVTNPRKLTQWFTSVGQLSPDSYSIRGLSNLRVRDVPTYSVIGNAGSTIPLEESTDGVVPYWSSHIPWGEQKVVESGHSVQDAPATAEYLRTALLEHLHRVRGKRKR